MNKKNNKIVKVFMFFILIFVFPILLSFSMFSYFFLTVNLNSNNQNLHLKPAKSNENFTVETSFPKVIWIEGNLEIEVETEEEGKLKYVFIDSKGGKYFSNLRTTEKISNSKEKISYIAKPHLITFPGSYEFRLVITYIDGNNSEKIHEEDLKTVLGLGYLILYCYLIISGTAIIVILTKKYDEEEEAALKPTSQPSDLPENKIKCPDCYKIIEEGLAFCPECGGRIPEFLRFSPNSTGLQ